VSRTLSAGIAKHVGTLIRWENSFPDIIVTLGTTDSHGQVTCLRTLPEVTCLMRVHSDSLKNPYDKVLSRLE
jgi:hypothetical protein